MKNIFIIFCYLFFTPWLSYSQMQPADSLAGVYAGTVWEQLNFGTWIPHYDTVIVSSIDSINCSDSAKSNNWPYYVNYHSVYYTNYYSCNTPPPTNKYMLFYAGDSVKTIVDSMFTSNMISRRFFGKKISSFANVNIIDPQFYFLIYPNPCINRLIIETTGLIEMVSLKTILGKTIISVSIDGKKTHLDLSKIISGVYLLEIKTSEDIFVKKIIVQN